MGFRYSISPETCWSHAEMQVLGTRHEWTPHDLVFTTRTGRPVEPRNLARSFQRITEAAGVRSIRLHDLRHMTATLLKDLGVSPRDTMEILGHARIAVTIEIYTAADDGSRRDAIDKLTRLITDQPGDRCCHCCCHRAGLLHKEAPAVSVTWVGLGGLEPPTSSLSGKPKASTITLNSIPELAFLSANVHCCADRHRGCHTVRHSATRAAASSSRSQVLAPPPCGAGCLALARPSACVHGHTLAAGGIVTQLVTQPHPVDPLLAKIVRVCSDVLLRWRD